jgi:hypothetical protein
MRQTFVTWEATAAGAYWSPRKKHYETVASFRIESGVFLFGPRERVVRKVRELAWSMPGRERKKRESADKHWQPQQVVPAMGRY